MRVISFFGAAALMTSSAALADTNVIDTFDAENGGVSALNYNGFSNFSVSQGSVDLVRSGDFGITCVGGSGSCVDLDGSTGASGGIKSLQSYGFGVGDVVTFSFMLSGNQRRGVDAPIFALMQFGDITSISDVVFNGGFNFSGPLQGTFHVAGLGGQNSFLSFDAPFQTHSMTFRALQAGSLTYSVRQLTNVDQGANDNIGPILDNVQLSIVSTAAVPEPATWALMILGFGGIGVALRSRQSRRLRYAT